MKMARECMVFLVLFGLIVATESANPDKCPVSLPQKSPIKCQQIREQRLVRQRAIYQIKPPTPGGIQPPLLNMTTARLLEVLGNDAYTKYHLQLYIKMAGFNTKLLALWERVNNGTPIEKIEDYKKIFYFFFTRQEPFGGKQFRTPSVEEPFPDVMSKWNNDKVFSELRLAGTNPMTLQRIYSDRAVGSCNAVTCGSGGTCLRNGRCRCFAGYTGPNAKKVGGFFKHIEADDCKTRCKFSWFRWKCPKNVPPRKQAGLKWSNLQQFLNPKFDWDAAVQRVLGTKDTLKSAIAKGYMYALRYPLCDKVVNVYPDVTEPNPNRKVWPFHSPIALFVSKPSVSIWSDETTASKSKESDDLAATEEELENQEKLVDTADQEGVSDTAEQYKANNRVEQVKPVKQDQEKTDEENIVDGNKHESRLHPVAVQMDYLPNSTVHTPADGDMWTLAKLNLQVTDYGYTQIVEHLLKVHLLMEPFCVVLPRHLSEDHPLHQILKFHCRGIMVTNTIGAPTLLYPGQFTHKLLAFGHQGSNQLVNTGYVEAGWHDTDFKNNIKKRGLDDRHSLPYFPYRDDGEVMYDAIEAMVTDYIHTYYLRDKDVKEDNELQRYVNEISADGKGPDGGRGMLKGFPAKVKTRKLLVNIITRLIAQMTIQHAAVNYPLVDYCGFTPLTPTKLYNDPRVGPGEFSVLNFPNANTAAIQATLTVNLATLRYDSLFDYSGELRDKAGREVVDEHFCMLRQVIQPLLEDRNMERFQGGQLTYPYFLPRWLPNGVQT